MASGNSDPMDVDNSVAARSKKSKPVDLELTKAREFMTNYIETFRNLGRQVFSQRLVGPLGCSNVELKSTGDEERAEIMYSLTALKREEAAAFPFPPRIPLGEGFFEVEQMEAEIVMDKIVRMMGDMWDSFFKKELPVFKIPPRRPEFQLYHEEAERMVLKKGDPVPHVWSESHKPLLLVLGMNHVYRSCGLDASFTKRELFYTHRTLFKSQEESDDILTDIACIIGCTRWSMKVVAATKGVVVGCLKYNDGLKDVDCTLMDMNGQLVPQNIDRIVNMTSSALFILLVEKDTVFHRLAEARFYDTYPCIIITGKGFPDVSTRVFLRKIKMDLKLPVFALMDFDASGLNILTNYMFGSRNMAYDSGSLVTPNIKWLGIRHNDLGRYGIPEYCMIKADKSGVKLAEEQFMKKNEQWHEELRRMNDTKKKVEIDALNNLGLDYMVEFYLPNKFLEMDWI